MGTVSGAPPAPAEGRARNFGPDAPKRGKGRPQGKRRDEGPKGPIPVRSGGRIYDVEDPDETPVEDGESFDDIARALPPDDDEGKSR
jgi:hypothetical protein